MTEKSTIPPINTRLAFVRNQLKLTQKQFALALLISEGHYAVIETGKAKINDRLIKTAVFLLNVNEDYLRNGKEPVFSAGLPLNPAIESHILKLRQLPPEFQFLIFDITDKFFSFQKP